MWPAFTGGGSPLMETITLMSRYDLEELKKIAKYLAGFDRGGVSAV